VEWLEMTLQLTRAQIALFALCGLLSILLFYELFAPLPEYSLPSVQARTEKFAAIAGSQFIAPPLGSFAQIEDRPVFNPLRTPVKAPNTPATLAAAGVSLPADLQLIGVMLDPRNKLAVFKSPEAPFAVSVGVGGMIDGWQVSSVEPDKAVLTANGVQQELKITADKSKATAGPQEPQAPQQPQQQQAQ
jgi:hypothetical protein